MFHHLMPSLEDEAKALLKALAQQPAPGARVAGLINLGRGVAFRIESPVLADIRDHVADRFASTLIPQDQAGWRPHVTVQNKVKPAEARALLDALSSTFQPRPITLSGLALWRYLGGPWEAVGAWRFGSGHTMLPPPPLPG